MFGYMRPLMSQLQAHDLQTYRSYYCGLCRAIRRAHGSVPTFFLQYDIAFFALLLDSLYEDSAELRTCRCPQRCTQRGKTYVQGNPSLSYAADVNLLLAYHKCRDDWADERSLLGLFGSVLLRPGMRRIDRRHPALISVTELRMAELYTLEKATPTNPDAFADPFAHLLVEIAVVTPSVSAAPEKELAPLRWLFYNLGRWITLIDAWEDREKDRKKHNCNPFLHTGTTTEDAAFLLYSSLSEAAKALALLPLRRNTELLENIVLDGCTATTNMVLEK